VYKAFNTKSVFSVTVTPVTGRTNNIFSEARFIPGEANDVLSLQKMTPFGGN
jgi:hypothetical protein